MVAMESQSSFLSTRDITFTAAGIALMAVASWVTVPLGPVPFTLQTMALAFVLVGMSAKQSTLAVVLYLVLGGLGLPVFAGMSGGMAALFGPTGGFLIGFGVSALVGLAIRRLVPDTPARDVAICVSMIVCSYAIGWAWLMTSLNLSAGAAFAAACAPFILPDAVKCAAGITMARVVRHAVPALAAQR